MRRSPPARLSLHEAEIIVKRWGPLFRRRMGGRHQSRGNGGARWLANVGGSRRRFIRVLQLLNPALTAERAYPTCTDRECESCMVWRALKRERRVGRQLALRAWT